MTPTTPRLTQRQKDELNLQHAGLESRHRLLPNLTSLPGGRMFKIIAGALGVLLLVALAKIMLPGPGSLSGTAYFSGAVHLYPGSDVDILGVKVGSVTAVVPEGKQVRVDFTYSKSHPVPANAAAVILAPTLVADRAVQLTPVYNGGPQLADHAVIPLSRTQVPQELDQVFKNVNDLSTALGPQGANKDGALTRLLQTSSANLSGEGQQIHDTITGVSEMTQTLAAHKDDLFGTIDNLQQLVTTLQQHDQDTRNFTTDLNQVSGQLDGERGQLSAALSNLASALGLTENFIKNNRQSLSDNLGILSRVTSVLNHDKQSLATLLDVSALGLTNYSHVYDPVGSGFQARFSVNDKTDTPVMFACSLVASVGQNPQTCLDLLKPLSGIRLTQPTNGSSSTPSLSPSSASGTQAAQIITGPTTLNGILAKAGR
jgi:phospholipid/cholesterol/gamma-HCH transport system substrate-binding protein